MKPIRTYSIKKKNRTILSNNSTQKSYSVVKKKFKNDLFSKINKNKHIIIENLSAISTVKKTPTEQQKRGESTNQSSSLTGGWLEQLDTTFDRILKNKKVSPARYNLRSTSSSSSSCYDSSTGKKRINLFPKKRPVLKKSTSDSESKENHESFDPSQLSITKSGEGIGSHQLIVEFESTRKSIGCESFNFTLSSQKNDSKRPTDTFCDNIELPSGIENLKQHSTLILPSLKVLMASTPLKENHKRNIKYNDASLIACQYEKSIGQIEKVSETEVKSGFKRQTSHETLENLQNSEESGIKTNSNLASPEPNVSKLSQDQSPDNISIIKAQGGNSDSTKVNAIESSQLLSQSQTDETLNETKLNRDAFVVLNRINQNEIKTNCNETKLYKLCQVVLKKIDPKLISEDCNDAKFHKTILDESLFSNQSKDCENIKLNYSSRKGDTENVINDSKFSKNCFVMLDKINISEQIVEQSYDEKSIIDESLLSKSLNKDCENRQIKNSFSENFITVRKKINESDIYEKSFNASEEDSSCSNLSNDSIMVEPIELSESSIEEDSNLKTENYSGIINLDNDRSLSDSIVVINDDCNDTNSSKVMETEDENEEELDTLSSPIKFKLQPGKKWRRSLTYLQKSLNVSPQRKGKSWRPRLTAILSENSACLRALSSDSRRKNLCNSEIGVQTSEQGSASVKKTESSTSAAKGFENQSRHFYELSGVNKDLEVYSQLEQGLNFQHLEKGYVSNVDRNSIEGLEENFKNLSISLNGTKVVSNANYSSRCPERGSEFYDVRVHQPYSTARNLVLQRCQQTEPLDFEECFPDSALKKCHKIGEGVYGEVFLLKNAEGGMSVLKIIPIEGDQQVNDANQKKFDEIISEIIIAQELSNLRNNPVNQTSCFAEVQAIRLVRGRYPPRLIELWELYDEDKGSENDHPSMFTSDQLYIVFELGHAGKDLEAYEFLNAEEAFAIFKQWMRDVYVMLFLSDMTRFSLVHCDDFFLFLYYFETSYALAVAEAELQFEHRDLHWGNVLISHTDEKKINFIINGSTISFATRGCKVTIIDYTLSRATYNNICIYNDLALDPDLFNSHGDYQFEIYKLMQRETRNEWQHFEPYTNILWLHYIIQKMLNGVSYRRPSSLKHGRTIKKMEDLSETLLQYKSCDDFVKLYFKIRG